MAGDDDEYGFYKTGHGKHNNEQAITCLACHDPAVMHVDGVARTYSAAADNYQAGYRLKLVDGGVPLDVPRSGSLSVEQFRLCFSCHVSAPFMNVNNSDCTYDGVPYSCCTGVDTGTCTDTNFRADVTDSGMILDELIAANMVNKHKYHLFQNQVWDSDWDLVSTDSAPCCTTCHNVHGPRLSGGASHAPAKILTGELIGRESEGALNLEYFINPWPDKATSLTN